MSIRKFCAIAVLPIGFVTVLAAQQPPAADHVAAIKESLQKSMATLRQYEWVQTTTVSLKGEEKSRTQDSCYYGADGKLQKVPLGGPPADGKTPRGLRGKIAEHKHEEISDSMKQAIGLVKEYIPPDPARIQAAKDAGRLTLTPPNAKGLVVVVIKDYLKAGDSLTLDVNAATNRIAGVTVSTFTDDTKDTVGLKVAFAEFADGTIYPATVQLDVAAQKLGVAIENSGYRKM